MRSSSRTTGGPLGCCRHQPGLSLVSQHSLISSPDTAATLVPRRGHGEAQAGGDTEGTQSRAACLALGTAGVPMSR